MLQYSPLKMNSSLLYYHSSFPTVGVFLLCLLIFKKNYSSLFFVIISSPEVWGKVPLASDPPSALPSGREPKPRPPPSCECLQSAGFCPTASALTRQACAGSFSPRALSLQAQLGLASLINRGSLNLPWLRYPTPLSVPEVKAPMAGAEATSQPS